MYSLFDYGEMIGGQSRIRLDTFRRAIQKSVHSESVVLEVGSGPGVFSLLALEAGARKVYAVEVDASIEYLYELAHQNGLSERIEIFHGSLREFDCKERVDVVISDLRGSLPLFFGSIPTLIDARERFLKPQGVLLPAFDTLYACPIEADKEYKRYTSPWENVSEVIDFSPLKSVALNTPLKTSISSAQCITAPQRLFEINYSSLSGTDFSGEASFFAEEERVCHGFGVWFATEIAAGIGYSNAPGEPELVYKQTFFPFLEPLRLHAGMVLQIELQADFVQHDYIWRWETKVFSDSESDIPDLSFEQSSFFAESLSYEQIKSNNPEAAPVLSARGEIERFVLESFDGKQSMDSIAVTLLHRFPEQLRTPGEALERVARICQRCGAFNESTS